jgi:hypothetical protein
MDQPLPAIPSTEQSDRVQEQGGSLQGDGGPNADGTASDDFGLEAPRTWAQVVGNAGESQKKQNSSQAESPISPVELRQHFSAHTCEEDVPPASPPPDAFTSEEGHQPPSADNHLQSLSLPLPLPPPLSSVESGSPLQQDGSFEGSHSSNSKNQARAASTLSQKSTALLTHRGYPKSWTPAWFDACARAGVPPEDLLERPSDSFWTPGASPKIVQIRHAHYEQRRRERFELVSATLAEAICISEDGYQEQPATTGHAGEETEEERWKAGIQRRMRGMKEAVERAVAAEMERKRARQAKELEAALNAERKRQEDLMRIEHKRQEQKKKLEAAAQEHARQVALAKEREAQLRRQQLAREEQERVEREDAERTRKHEEAERARQEDIRRQQLAAELKAKSIAEQNKLLAKQEQIRVDAERAARELEQRQQAMRAKDEVHLRIMQALNPKP